MNAFMNFRVLQQVSGLLTARLLALPERISIVALLG
jgi:hypothetical protein